MALTQRSIITLDNAKDFLGIQVSNDAYDSVLETYIDWASGWIEHMIGGEPTEVDFQPQKIAKQDVELVLNGDGSNRLSLPYPIVQLYNDSLDNLQYREAADEAWTNLLDDIDFLYIPESPAYTIELLGVNYFPQGRANIRIEYVAGYETVPDDLKILCLEKVAQMFKESGKGDSRFGLTAASSTANMGTNVSFKDMNPQWSAVLKRYRRRRKTIGAITI